MHNEFDNRPSKKIMSNNFDQQSQTLVDLTPPDNSQKRNVSGPNASSSVRTNVDSGLAPQTLLQDRQLQKKFEEIDSAQNFLQSQIEEVVKSFKLRIDRMQLHMTKTEQQVNGLNLDWSQKIHQIHVKVNEQKKYDDKIQELMDRHANLIKSYEVRIQALTRSALEKEGMLIQMQAALNETKMEIARLKRI